MIGTREKASQGESTLNRDQNFMVNKNKSIDWGFNLKNEAKNDKHKLIFLITNNT